MGRSVGRFPRIPPHSPPKTCNSRRSTAELPAVRISRSTSLAALRVAYLDHCQTRVRQAQLASTTLATYARGLASLSWLAEIRLDLLRCPDVMQWHREISRGMTSANAYLAYTALRVMLGWARREGLCEANVAAGLGVVHKAAAALPVRPEELAALCRAIEADEAARETRIARAGLNGLVAVAHMSAPRALRFLAGTGRRISEGCTIRVDAIDLQRRCVSLERTKTGPSAVILSDAMAELVVAQLRDLDGRSEYLWPSPVRPERPISKWAVYELFCRVCGASGLRRKVPHGLRHGVAYAALSGGAGLFATGKLLGHRSYKTTQRNYSGGVYVTPDMHDAARVVHMAHVTAGAVLQHRSGGAT